MIDKQQREKYNVIREEFEFYLSTTLQCCPFFCNKQCNIFHQSLLNGSALNFVLVSKIINFYFLILKSSKS